MRIVGVIIGMLAWTAAVMVPAWYVVAMAKAAVRVQGRTYALDDLLDKYTSMPWPLWLYTIAMTLLGTLLVVGGLRRGKNRAGATAATDDLSV